MKSSLLNSHSSRFLYPYRALIHTFVAKTAGVACLGVFCNQFGHQTNENNEDILNCLKHVRPGNGFEFAGDLFAKVNVNGAQSHPLFKEIRNTIKVPQDPPGDSKGEIYSSCYVSPQIVLSTFFLLFHPSHVCR